MNLREFNFDVTNTYWFYDKKYQMILQNEPSWDKYGNPSKDLGRADGIGRTFRAYVTYGHKEFMDGIWNCFEKIEYKYSKNIFVNLYQRLIRRNKKYYYQGHRYPCKNHPVGLSRDHLSYAIIAFKYSNYLSDKELKDFVKHLKFRISDFAKFTLDMWFWVRAVADIWWARPLYYMSYIPVMLGTYYWNEWLYKKTGFERESHQKDFKAYMDNRQKSEFTQKWRKRFYPMYAHHIACWQVFFLKKSFCKRWLQKIMLKICSPYNYVIRMVLGDNTVTKDDAYGYKSMTGSRWTTILQPELHDRGAYVMSDNDIRIKYNKQDEDYVRKLYDIKIWDK